ncbi:MAG: trehalose-phosphatase [Gemmatimonadales bacterium]
MSACSLSRGLGAARAFRGLAAARSPVLFLDLDGTLAPIVPRPEDARIPPETRKVLHRLRRSGARVVVVSGRGARDAFGIVGGLADLVLGNHGADWWDGRVRPWLGGDRRAMKQAARRLTPLVASVPGSRLEAKGYSLALHHGGTNSRQHALLLAVRRWLDGSGLVASIGHRVIDVRTPGITKGAAIVRWLEAVGDIPPAHLLYAGDDTTDRDAFHALPRGAVTIAVGPRVAAASARFRTPSPGTLARWLARLAEARG